MNFTNVALPSTPRWAVAALKQSCQGEEVQRPWHNGGLGGMKETGCEFLKRICAIAKGLPKSQWDRFEYKGDRGKLVLKILDEGDAGQGDGEAEIFPESGGGGGSGGGGSSSASASAGSGHSAGHRGMGDMDVNGQGMLETYTRKLKQVQENFGEDIDLSSEDRPRLSSRSWSSTRPPV